MTNMQSFWYNTSCLFGRICHFSFGQRLCCTRVWKEVVLTTSSFQKSSPARKALFHPSDQDSLCSREALITTHTPHMSFHASNGSICPNIKLFLWFFFPVWRFSSYFRHVPGCRLSFFSPYCTQMVVADLTLEERTCLNLLFSSCMLGDLGLARWSPPLLFSPFPPPSARITCGTEDRQTCQNVITYENKSILLQFKTDAC